MGIYAKNSLFLKYYAFSIAMCFFFSQYDFLISGFSIADFTLITSCVPLALVSRKVVAKNTGSILLCYFISLLFAVITIMITGMNFPLVSFERVLSRWIRYGAYAFLIVLVSDNCFYKPNDKNLILKIYRFFCYAFGIYAILQAIIFFLFNYMLPINILPIEWSRATTAESIHTYANKYYFRGFGTFLEPGYLSKFLLPGLAFSLFGWVHRKEVKIDMLLSFIIIVAIIFSTSVQGIMIASATLFVYILTSQRISTERKTLIIFLIVLFGGFLLASNVSTVAIDRIVAIFTGQNYGYSSNMRLFRGFAFWNEMPLLYKFFGIGLGNMANFAYINNIVTAFDYPLRDANYLEYCSGMSAILVQGGMFSIAIIIYWFIKSTSKLDLSGKIVLMQLFLVLLSGSGLFSITTIFYCALIFMNNKYAKVGFV